MKKLFIVLLAATGAVPAMAGNVYLSGSVGRSALAVDAYGTAMSGNETSFTLALGYQFNPGVGAEVGSAHFGKVAMQRGAVYFNCDNTVALYAALSGTLPVTDNLALYAKGGVARSDTGNIGSPGGGSRTHVSPLLGAGAGYALTPKATVFAEYLNFGKTIDQDGITMKAATVAAGIRYTF